MSEEERLILNKMIYCNLVSGEQALKFNSHIKEILQENEQLKDQLQQKENIIKELNDKIEDDKMIIEGNWGCIANLKKDYNLHKDIIKEIREYNKKIIEEGWYGGFEKDNAKHNLEILDKVD